MQGSNASGSRGVRLGDFLKRELERRGFLVVDYLDTRGCVDLIARKGEDLFIIRVLSNVDSLREDSVKEMIKLANILNGYAIIIGERTKKISLEDSIVYRRYGVPVVTVETFLKALDGDFPKAEEYKGKRIVFIDGRKLKETRTKKEYTIKKLADEVGVTKESIYRYEQGCPAFEEVVEKIEKVLNEKISLPVDVFRKIHVEPSREGYAETLERKGFRAGLFSRAPWDVAACAEARLFFSEYRGDLRRKIELFERARGISLDFYAFICKEEEKPQKIPFIRETEIEESESSREIIKIVRERNEEQ